MENVWRKFFVILGIVIIMFLGIWWYYKPTNYVNPNIPENFVYKTGFIPDEYFVEYKVYSIKENGFPDVDFEPASFSPYEEGVIVWGYVYDTDIIYQWDSDFYCKASKKKPLKIDYYKYSPGRGKFGGGSSRYALICGEDYYIVDYNSARGPGLYGPFQIN